MKITAGVRNAVLAACLAAVFCLWTVPAQNAGDALERGFQSPPESARPRVWWHWMSGNITKAGIKADLEWMQRIGLGGFQNFDAGLNTPQIVEKRLVYMTPEWKDAFKYAATLADELGLEMAIAGSPGWSESGGPWVPPAQAMKKYVWSETRVEGGRPFNGVLPKPPSTTGPFQNLARVPRAGEAPSPEFYADSAVIAYRAPASDAPIDGFEPRVTSSGGQFELAALTDGDLAQSAALPAAPAGQSAWIQFEFSQPQSIRGVTLVAGGGGRGFRAGGGPELQAGDDGVNFRSVTPIPGGGLAERTISFAPVTAKFFRVNFPAPQNFAGRGGPAPGGQAAPPPATQVAELVLHPGARVNRFEEKAAFSAAANLYAQATPAAPPADAVRKADVIDLTSRMRPDGTLAWTPPAGNWVVLRIGYSLTGAHNSPASPEATGLEVDKLSRAFVKAYFENYLDQYKDATGGLMGKRGLQYVITDSWEAGVANWTDNMMAEFARRRGYDMRPWLPVLAGRVVESAEASDRFLWDFRKTLADLTTENHYDQLTAILRERGMGRYTESHENGRAFIADGMDVKRGADVPMSAMWTPGFPNDPQTGYSADIRESASVAHIYGQNLVAAESLTARVGAWSFSPETLKPTADKEMAMGLNRFVIHTSVHQPVDDKIPGLGLGPYGQWFTRHETWAEIAKPWITYLARSSFMLQQGKFAADILYFYGEDSNITALFGARGPEIPAGYNFDYVNADAILRRLSVENGRIVTPSGMSYRVLALDPGNTRHISLPVLRKIRDLVIAGAAVVGAKPVDSPSQADDQAEFKRIVDQLWGAGVGKVYGSENLAQALAEMNVAPDFEYSKPRADTNLYFVHRKLPDGDVYWVNNRNARPESLEATFRVAGKTPELWHADTGEIEPASYRAHVVVPTVVAPAPLGTPLPPLPEVTGSTVVQLSLEPNDAVFVVFRKPLALASRPLPRPMETVISTVGGSWAVAFQPNRGAPAGITLPGLASWSESVDEGVKYFSGTATYRKSIQAGADWLRSGARLWLDLGDVKNLAEVSINGKTLGVLWKPPFRVDATDAVSPRENDLTIKVTNLWVNRLIGDQQPGAAKKYTYTAQQFYRADSPLLPSGLLGPVRFISIGSR